jgi:hypothetical protein
MHEIRSGEGSIASDVPVPFNAITLSVSLTVDDLAVSATLDSEPADVRGMRGFRLRDPDGFRLVISSERSA